MSATENVIEELIKLGDHDFLKSDKLFCFGDRQTRKTWNMVLKSFVKYFENEMKYKIINEKEFRVSWICPTLKQGITALNIVRKIAEKFKWKIIKGTDTEIILEIAFKPYIMTLISTEEQIRGREQNFTIVDEPEYIRNKKSFFRSLLVSNNDFLIGGSSYYPMGINPRFYGELK